MQLWIRKELGNECDATWVEPAEFWKDVKYPGKKNQRGQNLYDVMSQVYK